MTRGEDQTGRAALETELERLLSVDPSPEFTARVRARISNDAIAPAAFERWRWFVLRGAVVTAVIVAMLAAATRMNRAPAPDVAPQVRAVPEVPPSTPVAPEAERSNSDDAPVATTKHASAVRSTPADARSVIPVTSVAPDAAAPAARDPFSDVQVSASELKALRQIAMLMEGKRLELDERTPVPAVLDEVKELVITPITIEPIQLVMIKGDAE